MDKNNSILMKLDEIQPSQLYISSLKLERLEEWFKPEEFDSYDPIPIKELNGSIIFLDGHTRAFAAYLRGVEDVRVYWDEDELDWEAYQICVDWCINEGINTIKDLKDRVINNQEYEKLWYGRCREMQEELENKRKAIV